jgi:hypothetical protein
MGWLSLLLNGAFGLVKNWIAVKREKQKTEWAFHKQLQNQNLVSNVSDTTLRIMQLYVMRNTVIFKDVTFFSIFGLYVFAAIFPHYVHILISNIQNTIPKSLNYLAGCMFAVIWGMGKFYQFKRAN